MALFKYAKSKCRVLTVLSRSVINKVLALGNSREVRASFAVRRPKSFAPWSYTLRRCFFRCTLPIFGVIFRCNRPREQYPLLLAQPCKVVHSVLFILGPPFRNCGELKGNYPDKKQDVDPHATTDFKRALTIRTMELCCWLSV
ncbi:uncharacterized protein J3R85_001464 [Psidium guajava]|nr:uncharacterized protein J3R85_001464 [Psidium guajava]